MTDQELDSLLINILNKILLNYTDNAEYLKKYKSKEFTKIAADYKSECKRLSKILKKIKGLDDLADLTEDYIGAVYDYLFDYADNYIIPAKNSPDYNQAVDEYDNIAEILNLFLDSDDDEDFDDNDSEEE